MLGRVVLGVKRGGVYLVAAHFVERVPALALGMKLGRVPFAALHGKKRLAARHRFVVAGGVHLVAAHLILRLERVVAAEMAVE